MKSIFIEFPESYRELNGIIHKYTQHDYYSIPDTVDYYLELMVRMEINRRWYNADIVKLRAWLRSELIRMPVSDDYFENNVVQKYIVHSTHLWRAVREELPITPTAGFMMWHHANGVWKIITAGVSNYDP